MSALFRTSSEAFGVCLHHLLLAEELRLSRLSYAYLVMHKLLQQKSTMVVVSFRAGVGTVGDVGGALWLSRTWLLMDSMRCEGCKGTIGEQLLVALGTYNLVTTTFETVQRSCSEIADMVFRFHCSSAFRIQMSYERWLEVSLTPPPHTRTVIGKSIDRLLLLAQQRLAYWRARSVAIQFSHAAYGPHPAGQDHAVGSDVHRLAMVVTLA